jgi:hypothetical protein
MDVLKEFLESSTIHGLAYISTSKNSLVRAAWIVTVLCAVSVAINLINNSYVEWEDDPVSTTVSTLPISFLALPNITICPPDGSNTALNYDLMQASQVTLTTEDRFELLQEAKKIFLLDPYPDFLELMVAAVNPWNVATVYAGLQTLPEPLGADSFRLTSQAASGALATPWFGHSPADNFTFDPLYYRRDHTNHYVLDLTNLQDLTNHDQELSLVVRLEVRTRVAAGWQEKVEVGLGGPRSFRFYNREVTFDAAKAACAEQRGGSLASVLSSAEQAVVEELVPTGDWGSSWLGGTWSQGQLVWEDGSQGNFTNFPSKGQEPGAGCVQIRHNLAQRTKSWWTTDCTARMTLPYVCVFQSYKMSGSFEKEMIFPLDTVPKLEVWWDYAFQGDAVLDSWEEEDWMMTGFRMDWRIQDKAGALWDGRGNNSSAAVVGYGNTATARFDDIREMMIIITNWAANELERNSSVNLLSTIRYSICALYRFHTALLHI